MLGRARDNLAGCCTNGLEYSSQRSCAQHSQRLNGAQDDPFHLSLHRIRTATNTDPET